MFIFGRKKINATSFATYISARLSFVLKATLLLSAFAMFWLGQYQSAVETLMILLITILPVVLRNKFTVKIPHGFETLTVLFVFMSLFLGEVQSYYTIFWWWDLVLHSGSAFIMGVLGFLLVYVLNEKKEIELNLNRNFVALFAFMLAVGIGALWEVFEFTVDQLFGLNMQKSGLVDTMWDLIVNVFGALIISVLGWGYIKTRETDSFLERWIEEFIEKNPRFFEQINSDNE
ncbi:MAG: hypothetical protein P8J61_09985 [Gammaproteobacteria bacterium]|nr:hypothetical protein [Gammaproteobacteria bacterium]